MKPPTIIFDKSFLQSLNSIEAKVFDMLFQSNMTPIFLLEVLGDLEKKGKSREEQEKIIVTLSHKTPKRHYYANVNHIDLCLGELLYGHQFSMQEIPVCYQPKEVELKGEKHAFQEIPPEVYLLEKWQEGEFCELERRLACQYRNSLEAMRKNSPSLFDVNSCNAFKQISSEFEECKRYARIKIYREASNLELINAAITLLNASALEKQQIIDRWQKKGSPSFAVFAPYTAYIIFVHFFFQVAILKDCSRGERSSNWIDLAYLYYLPFTEIFISGDKLHKNIVPLFFNEGTQQFISAQNMKNELKLLVEYFNTHPDRPLEDIEKLLDLKHYLPHGSLIYNLYNQIYGPNWKAHGRNLVNEFTQEDLDEISIDVIDSQKAGEEKIRKGEWAYGHDSLKIKSVFRKFEIKL